MYHFKNTYFSEYDNYLIIKRQDEHEFKHFSGYNDCSLQIRKLYCEKIINEYLSADRLFKTYFESPRFDPTTLRSKVHVPLIR